MPSRRQGHQGHGGKCSCSLKKEPQLDTVPELDVAGELERPTVDFHKPRLTTTHSESTLTVFSNGHHKPVHKHNHMSQKCGVPYKIPRPHTAHAHTEMARRSVDNLASTHSIEALHGSSPIRDSILSAQDELRLVRSEHGSPHQSVTNLDELNGQLPPLDLSFSGPDAPTTSRPPLDMHSVTSAPFDSYFCGTPDTDHPILSAGIDAPSVDWSHFDLPLNSAFSSNFYPTSSYASFDYRSFGGPAMSNASSGEPSDIGDFPHFGNPSPLQPPSLVHNRFPSDSSDVCETESYRLSGTSSFQLPGHGSVLASQNLEALDIDDYINGAATCTESNSNDSNNNSRAFGIDRFPSPTKLGLGPTSAPTEDVFSVGPFELETSQKLGPTSVPRDDVSFSLPASAAELADSPWIAQFGRDNVLASPESELAPLVWPS
ncbi:MAG: hypothetical protein M1817_000442 [Caeruleum heppii]|nr:MAG: hypothetical protein M1817_000442 [Caeruleum heppii]